MTDLPGNGARIAFDVGSVRIGVARCGTDQIMALPVCTLPAGESLISSAVNLVGEFDAPVVYVGLPINLQGANTASTELAIQFAQDLSAALDNLEIDAVVRVIDERLSTTIASKSLQASGHNAKSSKELVDQAAAVEILESALAIEKRTDALAGQSL